MRAVMVRDGEQAPIYVVPYCRPCMTPHHNDGRMAHVGQCNNTEERWDSLTRRGRTFRFRLPGRRCECPRRMEL